MYAMLIHVDGCFRSHRRTPNHPSHWSMVTWGFTGMTLKILNQWTTGIDLLELPDIFGPCRAYVKGIYRDIPPKYVFMTVPSVEVPEIAIETSSIPINSLSTRPPHMWSN